MHNQPGGQKQINPAIACAPPLGQKTCAQRETLTIARFALEGPIGTASIGRRKGNYLVSAGKVDHGFTKASAVSLRERLTPLIRKTQPYAAPPFFKGIREDT